MVSIHYLQLDSFQAVCIYNVDKLKKIQWSCSWRDSLTHMFWECHIIQAFWRNVTVFLQNKLSINTELSYKKISFCNDSYPNVNGKNKSVSINFILLLANYSIFKCKNRKETPCMFQFEISISGRWGWEEIIVFNRNKTDQHIKKWQHLY